MPRAPRLSAEKYEGTLEKLARAHSGDARAREELVAENLPLVHFVLKRFRDRGAEYEDLYQYGCIGLVKAVDRFDPAYNVRFSTYAVPIIMGEVRRYLRDDGPVHVSRTIHDNAMAVERFRASFQAENAREPTINEIADGTRLDREDVVLALNAKRRVRSLSEPVGAGSELRLMDVLGTDTMERVDSRLTLSRLLAELAPDERSIILRRYFQSHTQSAIAKDMGISQVQVSRMESRIIKRMRARAEEG